MTPFVNAGPATAGPVARARDVCLRSEVLLGRLSIDLPCSLFQSNLGEFNAEFAKGVFAEAFQARRASVGDIELCQLQSDTMLHGGGDFLVTSGGAELEEQVPPALRHDPDRRRDILQTSRPVVEIHSPCVIVARYGEGTWGHWLGELVPRAALAEYFRPGEFNFVVPEWMTRRGAAGGLGDAALDSLAAFGVAENRLIRVDPGQDYRLTNAWMVAPIWSDHIPHPAAMDILRAIPPRLETVLLPRKLAVRRHGPSRRLDNSADIAGVLARHGYTSVQLGALPFEEQVALFREATHVFGTLGSDFTGLIFSPDHVRVLAAAPADWGDRFFYGLCQLRRGSYSEIRGGFGRRNEALLRDSTFSIDTNRLDEMLTQMG